MSQRRRPYEELRAEVESRGGSMTFKPGPTGGAWTVMLNGKSMVYPNSKNSLFPGLDELYAPLVEDPKSFDDYSRELLPDAMTRLLERHQHTTWIFQGNPDKFDIMGYLNAGFTKISWSVTRYADKIAVGDRVFLWQAKGKTDSPSGIVALATVLSEPDEIAVDPQGALYWKSPGSEVKTATRVYLKVDSIANVHQFVRREWLVEDPICRDLLILRQGTGTNFHVETHHAERLHSLWQHSRKPWTWAEIVAALRWYHQYSTEKIWQDLDSVTTKLSSLLGRDVVSTLEQLMAFQELEKRTNREGMSDIDPTVQKVWDQFHDNQRQEIRREEVEREYGRHWIKQCDTFFSSDSYYEQAEREKRHQGERSYEELVSDIIENPPPRYPKKMSTASSVFERDPRIVAAAKKRADFRCEVPDCINELFLKDDGTRYVEVHHIERLAEDGEDALDNVACVCPIHHREAHYGATKEVVKEQLLEVRRHSR